LKYSNIILFFSTVLLLSCGGSKKTTINTDSLYEDDTDDVISQTIEENDVESAKTEQVLRYENAIYHEDINTVLLHPIGFEMGNPLIHLNNKDSLLLSFDDLTGQVQKTICIPSFIAMPTGHHRTSCKTNI
jgi:hypothetical protein